jgi:hypothetical protein
VNPGESMRVRVAVVGLGLLVLTTAGCRSPDLYRTVYEALHAREELVNPSAATGRAPRRPDDAAYEAERQRLRDERAASGRGSSVR